MSGGDDEAKALKEILEPYLKDQTVPGNEPFASVSASGIEHLARSRGISLNQAMIACLEAGIWPERLRPNRGSLSEPEQVRLLRSRAVVIGCGGLGGGVILQLARVGLGGLTVCDGDVFEESNLNRQLLSSTEALGQPKALVAARQAATINPALEIRQFPQPADAYNLPDILADCQVAVDCLDNMPARYLLEEAAGAAGIPYVHGALAGLEGFVMVVRPGDPGLRGLHGPTPPAKQNAAEMIVGTPTPTPAAVGSLQVSEALKLLLGRPTLTRGQIMHLDLAAPSLDFICFG